MSFGLTLHCGANLVDRREIYAVKTPKPTETHFPIDHSLLLEAVEANLKLNNFRIKQQAHALTAGGMRYFGLIEVEKMVDDPTVQPDYGLVIGLRNTHDLSWSAALVMGSRVFICDNLAFSGEVLIGRKHTKNIARDIPILVPRAFGALSHERVCMERRIEVYKTTQITDKDANDMVVRSIVDEKIFPARYLPDIVREWRKPSHVEFEPRTVWSLMNSFTEIAKPKVEVDGNNEIVRGNLQTLVKRTQGLHGFFDKTIGLSLPTREELLTAGIEGTVTHNDAQN